jgi:pilus retraction protein PilT
VDLARTVANVRIRVNVFNSARGLSLAIRLLPGRPPDLRHLNLHPSLIDFCREPSGLILICGGSGVGKSTTIAAMVEEINRSRTAHVVSVEDPIEYRFWSRRSFIEQREIGAHVPSFEQGLIDVLRENPDVIVVGELREPETMRLTLNAAEAGHLVIASLHASNTEDALYRLCNSFPPEAQDAVRHQLASTLNVLLVQQLTLLPQYDFRVPVLSIMRGTAAVKAIIRENRLTQIETTLSTRQRDGMISLERYRREFIDRRKTFYPPAEVFRPSEEAHPEEFAGSPLVNGHGPAGQANGEALRIAPDQAAFAPAAAGNNGTAPGGHNDDPRDGRVFINADEAPLSDLVGDPEQD